MQTLYKLSVFTIILFTIVGNSILVYADDDTVDGDRPSSEVTRLREERRQIREEARENHEEARETFRDSRTQLREERKEEYHAHREVCQEQIKTAESDEDVSAVREACREEAREIREEYKAGLVEARKSYFESKKATFERRLRSTIELIDELPADQQADIMARLNARLDELEENAMDSENDDLLLVIEALREALMGE